MPKQTAQEKEAQEASALKLGLDKGASQATIDKEAALQKDSKPKNRNTLTAANAKSIYGLLTGGIDETTIFTRYHHKIRHTEEVQTEAARIETEAKISGSMLMCLGHLCGELERDYEHISEITF